MIVFKGHSAEMAQEWSFVHAHVKWAGETKVFTRTYGKYVWLAVLCHYITQAVHLRTTYMNKHTQEGDQ